MNNEEYKNNLENDNYSTFVEKGEGFVELQGVEKEKVEEGGAKKEKGDEVLNKEKQEVEKEKKQKIAQEEERLGYGLGNIAGSDSVNVSDFSSADAWRKALKEKEEAAL